MTHPPQVPSGWVLDAHDSLDSTSEEAKRLAANGAPGRMVVWSREQTAGRGRHGRGWTSPRGNLYLSVLLRPQCTVRDAPQIGFVVGAAMARAVRECTGVEAVLKWPNDLLVAGRKLSGILLDSADDGTGGVAWVIAGIGVNVAGHPAELPDATDLSACGANVAVEELLEVFLASLAEHLDVWEREGFAAIRTRWAELALEPGTKLTVKLPRETVEGGFDGIDEAGNLLLARNGETMRVSAGDVFPVTPAAA
jgi:BirA family biotin operon repressor/biotin-[acetyl-CoA-carboxylase] ligase